MTFVSITSLFDLGFLHVVALESNLLIMCFAFPVRCWFWRQGGVRAFLMVRYVQVPC